MRAAPSTALLLDAAGTLLSPREPVAATYVRFAARHGAQCELETVQRSLGAAMHAARDLRSASADWRPYWAEVVRVSTGCAAPGLLDDLYQHFAGADAWTLAPGARNCCRAVRRRGMKTAVVSNWDTRLRGILDVLRVWDFIDLAIVSAEVGIEKPAAAIFELACRRLGVQPARALHVGDSMHHDVEGARAAGLQALHFGTDVADFFDLRARLL